MWFFLRQRRTDRPHQRARGIPTTTPGQGIVLNAKTRHYVTDEVAVFLNLPKPFDTLPLASGFCLLVFYPEFI